MSTKYKEHISPAIARLRQAKGQHHIYGIKQTSSGGFTVERPDILDDDAIVEQQPKYDDEGNLIVETVDDNDGDNTQHLNTDLSNSNPTPDNTKPNHDWEKRYSDLKSYSDKKINELSTAITNVQNELKQAKTQAKAPVAFPKSEADMDAFRQEFPDLYDHMLSVAGKEAQKALEEQREELENLKQLRIQINADKAFASLLKLHPDAEEIKQADSFRDWYNAQPKGIQALLNSEDITDVAKGLDIFKAETGYGGDSATKKVTKPNKANTSNNNNSNSMMTPASKAAEAISTPSKGTPEGSGGNKKVWRESEVERMPFRQYERLELEIESARREGRFVYDITGNRAF